jgi:hypothetical protein
MKFSRFSLRELFLLVVIAAMGCGWWVEYRQHAQDADTIKALSFQRDAYMQRAEQLLEGVQQLERAQGLRAAAANATR